MALPPRAGPGVKVGSSLRRVQNRAREPVAPAGRAKDQLEADKNLKSGFPGPTPRMKKFTPYLVIVGLAVLAIAVVFRSPRLRQTVTGQ